MKKQNNNRILVITAYPPQGTTYGTGVGGAGHFISLLINAIKGYEFTVLAQKDSNSEVAYKENHIEIKRVWTKNSPSYFFEILKFVLTEKESPKNVLLNFEFKVFGGTNTFLSILNLLLLPLLVVFLRLSRKKIVTIMHPALLTLKDMQKIGRHIGINPKSPLTWLYTLGNQFIMFFLMGCSKATITFEQFFKSKFANRFLINQEKIQVIPLNIFTHESSHVQKKDREFNILFFGYLSPYKGIDWLVDYAVSKYWPKDTRLIIAGGESETTTNSNFYKSIVNKIKGIKYIKHTGFVDSKEIAKYFELADLVILPYTQLIASSGPLATAIGFKKPFIISDVLRPYTKTEDFNKCLNSLNINENEFIFKLEEKSLTLLIDTVKKEQNYKRLLKLSEMLHESRSVKATAEKYKLLFDRIY